MIPRSGNVLNTDTKTTIKPPAVSVSVSMASPYCHGCAFVLMVPKVKGSSLQLWSTVSDNCCNKFMWWQRHVIFVNQERKGEVLWNRGAVVFLEKGWLQLSIVFHDAAVKFIDDESYGLSPLLMGLMICFFFHFLEFGVSGLSPLLEHVTLYNKGTIKNGTKTPQSFSYAGF